jgi:hypothetical protein
MHASTLPKAKKHFSLRLVTGSGLQSNKYFNELLQNEILINDLFSE